MLQQRSGNTNRYVARIRCASEIHRGRLLEAVRLPMALPTSIPGSRCLLQATCIDEAGVFGGEGQLVVRPDGVLNFGESRDYTPSSTVCSLALLRFENSPGTRNLSSPRLFINAIITTLSIRVHHQLRLGLCVRRHQGGQRIAQLSV